MNQDKDIHDELEGLAPYLSKIEKVEPFQVPAGYFDEFPAKVRETIALKEAKPQRGWLGQLIPRYSYIAASLCFLLIVGGFLFVKKSTSMIGTSTITATQQMKTVPTDEYVIERVDEDLLTEPVSMQTQETKSTPETKNIKSKKSNVSEQYILENIEESTITEEL